MNDISILLIASIASIWFIGSASIIIDMIINSKDIEQKMFKYKTPAYDISKEEIEEELQDSFVVVLEEPELELEEELEPELEQELKEEDNSNIIIERSNIFENMTFVEDPFDLDSDIDLDENKLS
jgi:hypothetical protein